MNFDGIELILKNFNYLLMCMKLKLCFLFIKES